MRRSTHILVVALLVGMVLGANIEHFVVLMLENRSFDHMCGWLNQLNSEIDGLTGKETNTVNGETYAVNGNCPYINPFDPNHSFQTTTQEFMGAYNAWIDPAPMSGFALNAYESGFPQFQTVMEGFTPDRVPAISTLATNFAVFDHYYASIPGPTLPNRLYMHSGTSHGHPNCANTTQAILDGYPQESVFDVLDIHNISWKAYYQDASDILLMSSQRQLSSLERIQPWANFLSDAAAGTLPQYTWLSPAFFPSQMDPARDQHPDHDVVDGEMVIAEVYQALRNSSKWNNTVLVVTWDEHGGFYDHVPPPAQHIPNPDGIDGVDPPFNFTRLGSRLCTVVASPLVPRGTVVHEPTNPPMTGSQYEHPSVYATLEQIFGFQYKLTNRTAFAAPFDWLFSLNEPRTDCPATLPVPIGATDEKSRAESLKYQQNLPPNGLQKDLFRLIESVYGRQGNAMKGEKTVDDFKTQTEMGDHVRHWMNKLVNDKQAKR